MRPTRDEWAMGIANLTSLRATCLRRKVGAVLLNGRGHLLATGFNGVAAGQKHCNEVTQEMRNPALLKDDGSYRLPEHWENPTIPIHGNACAGARAESGQSLDLCQAIHAEQNALLQCRNIYDIDTAYVTTMPCATCTKLLLNTSCRRIVYQEEYAQTEGKAMWMAAGRVWEKYKEYSHG